MLLSPLECFETIILADADYPVLAFLSNPFEARRLLDLFPDYRSDRIEHNGSGPKNQSHYCRSCGNYCEIDNKFPSGDVAVNCPDAKEYPGGQEKDRRYAVEFQGTLY